MDLRHLKRSTYSSTCPFLVILENDRICATGDDFASIRAYFHFLSCRCFLGSFGEFLEYFFPASNNMDFISERQIAKYLSCQQNGVVTLSHFEVSDCLFVYWGWRQAGWACRDVVPCPAKGWQWFVDRWCNYIETDFRVPESSNVHTQGYENVYPVWVNGFVASLLDFLEALMWTDILRKLCAVVCFSQSRSISLSIHLTCRDAPLHYSTRPAIWLVDVKYATRNHSRTSCIRGASCSSNTH